MSNRKAPVNDIDTRHATMDFWVCNQTPETKMAAGNNVAKALIPELIGKAITQIATRIGPTCIAFAIGSGRTAVGRGAIIIAKNQSIANKKETRAISHIDESAVEIKTFLSMTTPIRYIAKNRLRKKINGPNNGIELCVKKSTGDKSAHASFFAI
jgi:hypothetical protein